jgi:hypothetical protein
MPISNLNNTKCLGKMILFDIGLIVFIGKLLLDKKWELLSIPRGDSEKCKSSKNKCYFQIFKKSPIKLGTC